GRRPQRLDNYAAEGRLGGRIQGVERKVPRREAVRLSVGRRHPFQYSSGRRPPVHSGAHGSDSRGKEGANRRGRRLPRERAVVEGTASGRGGPRTGYRPEARYRRWGAGLLESP